MPFDPNKDRIDKLQEDLYSRQTPDITREKRPSLSSALPSTPPPPLSSSGLTSMPKPRPGAGWSADDELGRELAQGNPEPKRSSFFGKLFLVSLAFFVVAAVIAGVIFSSGLNVISSKNVDITANGLVAVAAGQELALDLVIKNGNSSALEAGKLYIEYPDGARVPNNITTNLVREEIDVESIPSGDSVSKTIRAVLFGEKDSIKQIKVSFEYKPRGSNASFTKEKTFDIAISSAPVVVNADFPREVNAGQEFDLTIGVVSNSTALIRDLLVRVDYPFGFSPSGDALPKASYANNVWLIGDLAPTEKKTIIVHGRIEGQDEEERTFRITTGVAKEGEPEQVGLAFMTSAQSLIIKKPFIAVGLQLEGSDGKEVVTQVGNRVQGVINWANNLTENLNDLHIEVKFSGQALDRDKVGARDGGFYRSVDNTISWTKSSTPSLSSAAPAGTGSVSFDAFIVPLSKALSLPGQGKNMEILVDATVSGTRITPGEPPQTVVSKSSQKIKIGTNLSLNARLLYSIGPFRNNGPIPPRADQKTTYTVTWTLSNSFNDAGNVIVSAVLPPYVTWLGVTAPLAPVAEKISYDQSNNIVMWQAGEVKAAVGSATSPREASFQISFQPSLSQVGQTPNLLENMKISATDRFTQKTLDLTLPSMTTRMSTDPTYDFGDEKVVR